MAKKKLIKVTLLVFCVLALLVGLEIYSYEQEKTTKVFVADEDILAGQVIVSSFELIVTKVKFNRPSTRIIGSVSEVYVSKKDARGGIDKISQLYSKHAKPLYLKEQ